MAGKMTDGERAALLQRPLPPMAMFEVAQCFARWVEKTDSVIGQHQGTPLPEAFGPLGPCFRLKDEGVEEYSERCVIALFLLAREV